MPLTHAEQGSSVLRHLVIRDFVAAPRAELEQLRVGHGPPVSRVVPYSAHESRGLEDEIPAWWILHIVDELERDPFAPVDDKVADWPEHPGQASAVHGRSGPSWREWVGH